MLKKMLTIAAMTLAAGQPLLAHEDDDRYREDSRYDASYDDRYDDQYVDGYASRHATRAVASIGRLAQVEVVDRKSGRSLPIYRYRNAWYVAGEPGRNYSIRMRSQVGRPLVAVASVDGVNVISGQDAGYAQIGYALTPHDGLRIDGWRKSYQQVARFQFARGSQAYATRTGRPDNLGVIGIALFRDDLRAYDERDYGGDPRRAPYAKSYPGTPQPQFGTAHGSLARSPTDPGDYAYARGRPDETIRIYYDSRQNLIARGIIPPQGGADGRYGPNPFPVSANEGFVPNPW